MKNLSFFIFIIVLLFRSSYNQDISSLCSPDNVFCVGENGNPYGFPPLESIIGLLDSHNNTNIKIYLSEGTYVLDYFMVERIFGEDYYSPFEMLPLPNATVIITTGTVEVFFVFHYIQHFHLHSGHGDLMFLISTNTHIGSLFKFVECVDIQLGPFSLNILNGEIDNIFEFVNLGELLPDNIIVRGIHVTPNQQQMPLYSFIFFEITKNIDTGPSKYNNGDIIVIENNHFFNDASCGFVCSETTPLFYTSIRNNYFLFNQHSDGSVVVVSDAWYLYIYNNIIEGVLDMRIDSMVSVMGYSGYIYVMNNLFDAKGGANVVIMFSGSGSFNSIFVVNNVIVGAENCDRFVMNQDGVVFEDVYVMYNYYDHSGLVLTEGLVNMSVVTDNVYVSEIKVMGGEKPLPYYKFTEEYRGGFMQKWNPMIDYQSKNRSKLLMDAGPFETHLCGGKINEQGACNWPLNGECLENGCKCNKFYRNDSCQSYYCDPVCVARTYCGGPNLCVPVCVPSCDPDHGVCIYGEESNKCECKEGYGGKTCDDAISDDQGAWEKFWNEYMLYIITGGAVTFIVIILISLFCVILCLLTNIERRKKNTLSLEIEKINDDMLNDDLLVKNGEKTDAVINFNMNKDLFVIDFKNIVLQQRIGEGASGKVFKASWNGNITVAVKMFNTDVFSKQEEYDEFEKELTMMASISHVNILKFFGATIRARKVGIVTEYCEKDLVAYIITGEQLKLCQKIAIITDIVKGMQYLHSRRIIHRDLKSKNILMKDDVPKIIDFGLSRVMTKRSIMLTRRVGTSYYMAPEVTNGSKYDERCDVFSFGMIMYEILFNTFTPYGKDVQENIEVRVANSANFRPKIPVENNIDGYLLVLMQRCWAHQFEERPSFKQIYGTFAKYENLKRGEQK